MDKIRFELDVEYFTIKLLMRQNGVLRKGIKILKTHYFRKLKQSWFGDEFGEVGSNSACKFKLWVEVWRCGMGNE